MRWRLGYNARLWLLVAALLIAVNVFRYFADRMEQSTLSKVGQGIVFLLIPVLAVFVTRLVVPRRTSRVEAFRGSPLEEDRPKRAVGESPDVFSKRLASYLHVSEAEVLSAKPPATSAMPFWSAVPLPRRSVWAKSVEYIRAVLARIRDAVRG